MSEGRVQKIVGRIAAFIEARGVWISLAAFVLLIPALWVARDLRVDQNFRRLLPDSAPEVQRLDATDRRIGNQSHLLLAIRSPDRAANIRFGEKLADELRARSELELRYVLFHQDPRFFEKNALLYASLADLLDLRERVRERIKKAVKKKLDLNLDDEAPPEEEDDDSLSKENLKERYQLDKRLQEYMESDEGRVVVVKARPERSNSDLAYARKITEAVESIVQSLKPDQFHPELTVEIEGSFAENTRRARSMQSAILQGTLACIAFLLLCIAVYFRSARAVFWILVPLLISVVFALVFAQLNFGHLNLVSAFIFAILLGLGIDFGVHILSRYRDERSRGLERAEATEESLGTTGLSTAAGALSTAGCFFVLSFSQFQGFAQFGMVAGVGILCALLAAYVVMPSLVRATGGRGDHRLGSRAQSTGAVDTPTRRSTGSIIIVFVGLVVGCYGIYAFTQLEWEYDLRKLGPQRTTNAPKADAAPKKALPKEVGGPKSAPAIVLTRSLEETAAVHRQLSTLIAMRQSEETRSPGEPEVVLKPKGPERKKFRALWAKASRVGEPSEEVAQILDSYDPERRRVMKRRIDDVFSIYDYVPDGQADKLVVIKDIKKRIDRKRKIFEGKDREELDQWYHYLEVTETFGVDDLPQWVKSRMTDRSGQLGHFVIFYTKGPKADYLVSSEIRDAFFDLKLANGSAPSAAEYYVLPAIIDAIRGDAAQVIGLALLVMIIASWLLLGGLHGPVVVLAVVGFALTGLAAVMHLMGWKADMFNIIALPLLVGMGQDDAMHIYHRYREGGPDRITRAVRESGSAIFLTTLTTCIGFSGIFFSNHSGLLSLAKVAVVGMILCWLSSVVLLPAFLRIIDGDAEQRADGKSEGQAT